MGRKPKRQLPAGHQLQPTITVFPGNPKKQRTATRCQHVKADHTQCKRQAVKESDKCRRHGGALAKLVGPANPNWKGGTATTVHGRRVGRWVEFLAPASQASYIKSLQDPELLSLVGEINLVDVRLEEAIKRTTTFADWSAVKVAYDSLVKAMAESNSAMIRDSLEQLRDLSYGQIANDHAWREVLDLTERRRELVESERRRKVELSLYLTREQAQMNANLLLEIIRRNVKDRDVLISIVAEYKAAMDAARGPVIDV